jgi:hypothetical protein
MTNPQDLPLPAFTEHRIQRDGGSVCVRDFAGMDLLSWCCTAFLVDHEVARVCHQDSLLEKGLHAYVRHPLNSESRGVPARVLRGALPASARTCRCRSKGRIDRVAGLLKQSEPATP